MTARDTRSLALGLALVMTIAMSGAARAQTDSRVIALGGAITEIVYALGEGERLVAVDSTSRHPSAAEALPNVGYMRQLAAEPILALTPDRILAVADAGPSTVLDQVRATGVDIVRVADEPTPRGVIDKVTTVAAALGVESRGRALAARLRAAFADLRRRVERLEARPTALCLISVGRGTLLAAGRGTSAAGIIELAGGRNAIDAYAGFKPLTPEAVVKAAPQWIVTSRNALDALGGREALRQRPALANTPAVKNDRIIAMDGLLLLGFGPRTPQAASRLAAALHPQQARVTD